MVKKMRWETCRINTLHCGDDDGKANVAISRFSCCITPVSTNVNSYLQKSDSHPWEVGTFITPRFTHATRVYESAILHITALMHRRLKEQMEARTPCIHISPSTRVVHLGLKTIRVLRIFFLLSFHPTPDLRQSPRNEPEARLRAVSSYLITSMGLALHKCLEHIH